MESERKLSQDGAGDLKGVLKWLKYWMGRSDVRLEIKRTMMDAYKLLNNPNLIDKAALMEHFKEACAYECSCCKDNDWDWNNTDRCWCKAIREFPGILGKEESND